MNKTTNVYRQVMARTGIMVVIILPISFLYDYALTTLDSRQVEVQSTCLAVMVPIVLLLFAYMMKVHMRPLTRVIDKIRAGGDVSDDEATRAERRALLMPYITGIYAVVLFFGISLVNNWMLRVLADLSLEMFVYLVVSSMTTAIMMGIGGSFFVRKPLREALLYVMENSSANSVKPPLFVPISAKVTVAFSLIIALFLVFAGLLSSVTSKRMLEHERQSAQRGELKTVQAFLKNNEYQPEKTAALLASLSGPGVTYYLADSDFRPIGETGASLSADTIKDLRKTASGGAVTDASTGWSWTWADNPDSGRIVLSGREPVKASVIGNELKNYYAVAAFMALLVGLGVGMLIAGDISSTLKQLSESAVSIAEGATDAKQIPGGEDETGILARAFNRMGGVLLSQLRGELERGRAMIAGINDAVTSLAPMSRELVAIAEQQASSSVEQSSAAEEAATTSGEIVAVAKQIASHAAQVSDGAEKIKDTAVDSSQRLDLTREKFDDIDGKMNNIAETILKLGERSDEIVEIVHIIDEISDQTNLLALNAALEAVGAGEHGRRFQVVAQEIRRLAQSTSEATKKIQATVNRMKAHVDSSIASTEEGKTAVVEGRNVMESMTMLLNELFEANTDSVPRLKEIGLMTSQQATASEQMTHTVNEVRTTARQGSAAAEQIQVSLQELENIIAGLQSHIDEN